MRALIYTFGTRGDVQPYVALARRLVEAGHEAAVCTAEGFRAFVEGFGVTYLHLGNAMLDVVQDVMAHPGGVRHTYRMLRAMSAAQRSALGDQWTAAQEYRPSIVVCHPKALGGYHIAERLGVRCVLSLPLPFFTPTRDFPIPFIGSWPLGGRANRATYQLQRFTALVYGGMINDFRRQQLGLDPISRTDLLLTDSTGRALPILYPFSRHVVAVPADYPPQAHVTGYWFLDPAKQWQPPAELDRFLAAGPPPLYVGFGSMGFGKGAEARRSAIVEAVGRLGARAVVASGWSSLTPGRLGDDVLVVDDAPHDWLFPRVSAVVHHGGSGTTGAGLRAGRPTLVCPLLGDQPFWGHQVRRLGAGPDPLPLRRLDAATLESRLRDLLSDEGYRRRAEHVGSLIRSEDGPGAAVAVLESVQP